MKREDIKAIFADATDEQLKAVMDINGADVEKVKLKVSNLEKELNESKEAYKKITSEMEQLKTENATAEDWRAKFEALQAENVAKEKQAEADRILQEKQTNIENRFKSVLGDKKFSHSAIEAEYLKKFGEAIESKDYEGKSDADIFNSLTGNDEAAFKGVTAIRLSGGTNSGVGAGVKYSSKEEVMKIKDAIERQNAIRDNPELFR